MTTKTTTMTTTMTTIETTASETTTKKQATATMSKTTLVAISLTM